MFAGRESEAVEEAGFPFFPALGRGPALSLGAGAVSSHVVSNPSHASGLQRVCWLCRLFPFSPNMFGVAVC